jgi:NAD-dependent histone deacetylase SIR2
MTGRDTVTRVGDFTMAAQEAVPSPALSVKAQPAAGCATKLKTKDEDTPAPEHDEDEGGVWDSASLYEEILDEVEAFEYSTDGECGLQCVIQYNN